MAKLLYLGIKNKRVYFILLLIFRNFARKDLLSIIKLSKSYMKGLDVRSNPMVAIGVLLVLGIWAGRSWCDGDMAMWLVATFVVIAIVAYLLRSRRHISSILTGMAVFITGMLVETVSLKVEEDALSKGKEDYEAVVMTEPEVHGKVVQMELLVLRPERDNVWVRASVLRDTVQHRQDQLHVGSGIKAWSKIERGRNRLTTFIPCSSWQFAKVDLHRLTILQRQRMLLAGVRQHLSDVFANQAVVRAMVLGDKSQLSSELRDDYSRSGASHLLALSGLHIGIIYGLLMCIVFFAKRQWFTQAVVLLVVWGYAVLVGLMPSVVRSACMITIYSLVSMTEGRRRSINVLALAAVVMLFVSPDSLWDLGFQMSFLSVLSILIITPKLLYPFRNTSLKSNVIARWVLNMFAVTIAAQLGTSPLVAYVFGRLPVYGVLFNLVAVPLAMCVVCLTVLCLLFIWQPWMLTHLRIVVSWLSDILNQLVGFVSSLPGATVEVQPSLLQVVLCYVVLASLLCLSQYFIKVSPET